MNIIVESLGTFANPSQKQQLSLSKGEMLSFDYDDEKITVTIESVESEFYNISLSHGFCLEVCGKINLNDARTTFILPKDFETVLALPLYDASYKLKFSSVKEND